MRRRRPFSRRVLLVSFVAILGGMVGVLAWLGWQLDRAVDRQEPDRLASTADQAVAAIERRVAATQDQLVSLARAHGTVRAELADAIHLPRGEAALLVVRPTVWLSPNLLFYPDESDPVDASAAAFAVAEHLEFIDNDQARALASYRDLTSSREPGIRAGAWARVARVSVRLRHFSEALSADEDLLHLSDQLAFGRSADLIARIGRCTALEGLGRPDDVRREAILLNRDLLEGRWRLSRGRYRLYSDLVGQWLGPVPSEIVVERANAEALATSVSVVLDDARSSAASDSRPSVRALPGGIVVVESRTAETTAALVVLPSYVTREWLSDLPTIAHQQRASVTLTDGSGFSWFGRQAPRDAMVRRVATDTPFTVAVAAIDPQGDAADARARSRLIGAMLVTLTLIVVGATVVVGRGMSRELEVARLQSDFVSAVSHEFRTPVSTLRQFTEMLDDGRVKDEGARAQYYRLMRRETERLQRLIEGLLDFGRMEAAEKEYRFELLSPTEIVRDVTAEFGPIAEQSSHAFDVTAADSLPPIRADRQALTMAIWNLLDNAAKYSPSRSPIEFDVSAAGDAVVFRVRDHGGGIPAAEQAKIFERFVRGSNARTSGAKGTGLGLAMVKHIARAHGGEVSVANTPGGSEFRLAVPFAEVSG